MRKKCLYHYCSLNSFISIIQSKTIKLSEITKSNDSEEIKFLWEHYVSYIESHSKNKSSPPMLEYEIDKQMSYTDFLVACFSKKRDSLHMWSCYGNGGVCIGFDEEKLREWAKHILLTNNGIIYYSEQISGQAKLDQVKYYNKRRVEAYIAKQCKDIEFVTDPFPRIFDEAPFAKTSFWAEEKEWRISLPVICKDRGFESYSNLECNVHDLEKVNMEVTQKGSSVCISCFIPFSPEMINCIILAPNCGANENDLKKALLMNDFDHLVDKIRRSNGSLR